MYPIYFSEKCIKNSVLVIISYAMEIYAGYSFHRHCFVWREMLFYQNSSYFFKVNFVTSLIFHHIPIQYLIVLIRTFYMNYGYTLMVHNILEKAFF